MVMAYPNTTVSMLRNGIIAIKPDAEVVSSPEIAATAMYELLNLGFVAHRDDLRRLTTDQLTSLIFAASQAVGSDRTWEPLFPGFPAEVLRATDADLLAAAVVHYVTEGQWRPDDTRDCRRADLPEIDWAKNRRVLELTPLSSGMIRRAWAGAIAMSPADRQFVTDIARSISFDAVTLFRDIRFNNGENFAAALLCLRSLGIETTEVLRLGLNNARNVDDILRSILVCFCRDYQRAFDLNRPKRQRLPLNPIPRPARREILKVLSLFDDGRSLDLAVRRKDVWRSVMRRIHPFELNESVGAEQFLDVVFDNVRYRSFNARVEALLAKGDVVAAANLLTEEPGNLVRRIRHLVRLAGHPELKGWEAGARAIEFALAEAGPKVRLSTLISAYNGLANHTAAVKIRKLRRRFHITDVSKTEKLEPGLLAQVLEALENAILARLTLAPAPVTQSVATGSSIPVELVRRQASSSMTDIWPGERIQLNPTGNHAVLRVFVHWFDEDVDLGVSFTDAEFSEQLSYLDYTNMNSNRLRRSVIHSGDVVKAPRPKGGCEFIDIRLGDGAWTWENLHLKSLNMQLPSARYAVISVASFSGQPFSAIDNIAGVMVRNDEMAGLVFEPRTVETASTLNVESTSAIPFIVDLTTNELIWIDSSLGTIEGKLNLENTDVVPLAYAELTALSQRLTNGQLLKLWAQAHGVPTTDEPAETGGKEQVTRLLKNC